MKLPFPLAAHALLAALEERGYQFVTPTPATHARVVARRERARDLRDVLGWSLPFSPGAIEAEIVELLQSADLLDERGEMLLSKVRVSSLGDHLFLHSAYPTIAQDAVFFGPDSYRFATFLEAELSKLSRRGHLVDFGAGSGVGAIVAAKHADDVSLLDINANALRLARANALHAEISFRISGAERWRFLNAGALEAVEGAIDCIIANPPYIADPAHRAYRDGGGMHGGELSLAWAREAAARLVSGGAFLLYTGSAIVGGEDELKAALGKALEGFDVSYREIDPDVFGEELEREDYADVDRIAVVGLVAVKR
ncbi:MAG: class I SAM-dependent methyltransferase [Terricaulis sp.]